MEAELAASFFAVIAVWLVTVITPGPNFMATAHAALHQSPKHGVALAVGIGLGTTIWATASLLGLGILFQTMGWLYQAVKVAGAAYLIGIGAWMIFSARPRTPIRRSGPTQVGAAFRRGVLTDLSNPKAAAFFTSLFAVAVPPGAPPWFNAALISAVVAIATGWYALVALGISAGPAARFYQGMEKAIRRMAGAVFIAFGVRLAAD